MLFPLPDNAPAAMRADVESYTMRWCLEVSVGDNILVLALAPECDDLTPADATLRLLSLVHGLTHDGIAQGTLPKPPNMPDTPPVPRSQWWTMGDSAVAVAYQLGALVFGAPTSERLGLMSLADKALRERDLAPGKMVTSAYPDQRTARGDA